MIEIIQGAGVGAGKTYFAVLEKVIPHLVRGGTVYCTSNFQLNWPAMKDYVAAEYGLILEDSQYVEVPAADTWRIHEITPPGTDECPVLIVLDECHAQLNSRDWNDSKKRAMFDWATQSRHDDNDLLFISQHFNNIDNQVRKLATFVWNIKNGSGLPKMLTYVMPWMANRFFVNQCQQDGKTVIEHRTIPKDKKIFGVYTSKSMRGTHKRGRDAVAKLTLKKIPKKMRLVPIILVGLFVLSLVAGAFGIARLKKNGLVPHKPTVEQAPPEKKPAANHLAPLTQSLITSQAQSADCCGSYDIVNEKLRGTDFQTYMRTDQATYLKGQMSPKGFVVSIQGSTVRIESPKGRTVFVVAQDAVQQFDSTNQPIPAVVAPATLPATLASSPVPSQFTDPSYVVSNPVQLLEANAMQSVTQAAPEEQMAPPRQRVNLRGTRPAISSAPPSKNSPVKGKITVKDSSGRVSAL